MKICVVGAGAVGGLMAAKLAAGNQVTVVARGAHLRAIQQHGLRLNWHDGSVVTADVDAVADATGAGPQDLVILAVKAHALASVAPQVAAMMGDETMILPAQNGIPWWYFHRLGGPYDGHRLSSLDPDGVLAAHIPSDRVIGCVVYTAAAVAEPGVIRHVEGRSFPVGELDGASTARVRRLAGVLEGAGLRSQVSDDIRAEIWLKAWGNLCFNPVSALTHATLVDIARYPPSRDLVATMMREARAVAGHFGITFRYTVAQRIAGAEAVGPHKTSMLQDVEAGRALEIEAITGAVLEMARLTGTDTPAIAAVYACVKLLNETMATRGAGLRLTAAG